MRRLRGLLVDWGGVLTSGLGESMAAWAADDGIDYAHFSAVMGQWLGPEARFEATYNPVHALERGELEVPEFEQHLAQQLWQGSGAAPSPDGVAFSLSNAAKKRRGCRKRSR